MIVFKTAQELAAVYRDANRPLDDEALATMVDVAKELADLGLSGEWVLLQDKCRVCGYESTAIVPAVADLDNLECVHCGNMTAQEIDAPEWWEG